MSQSSNSYSPSLCKMFDHPWCHAAEKLWLVFSPILLIIGTIGNVLSICVLLRKRMRQSSASVYLISLACADTAVLYIGLLREWLVHLTETDYRKENDVTCKLQLWLQFVAFNSSMWLLTAFTVDRQISVVWPIFARTRCTRKIQYVIVAVIPLVIMIGGSHYFFMERQVTYQWSNITNTSTIYIIKCVPTSGWYANFYHKIWPMILIFIASICPAVIIFISNVRILKVILTRNKRVAPQHKTKTNIRKKTADVNRTVNSMLITVSCFYILSTLPICVYLFLESSLFWHDTPQNVISRKLFWAITCLLFYSNSAVNFLLYCFSGSMFRLVLKEMIVSSLQFLLRKITGDAYSRGNGVSSTAVVPTESTSQTQQSQRKTSQQKSYNSRIIQVMPTETERVQKFVPSIESEI